MEAFEREAAAYLGVPHALGVANGTDALVLSLEAMGVGRGDEVICPSFTFYATAEAIARVGATPVFADIDPATLNVDPEDVAARITERTKAIVPVHLFGRPAPLAALAALGVPLLEDAAQAFGAPGIATTGVCSTFSFFPTKNLFALGDGGLIACTDDVVAETVRMLRFHGSVDKQTFELDRDELAPRRDPRRGAPRLPPAPRGLEPARDATQRRATPSWASARSSSCPATRPGHVYHMFVVRSPERDRIADGAHRRRHRVRLVLRDAAPSPAGDGLPRVRARVAARRRSARPPRTSRCRCGAGSAPRSQERVVATVRAAVGVAV